MQAGIKFTLTEKHVSAPNRTSFQADLDRFVRVCRVVNGVRGVRLGAVGARPGAFNTVRYSEKILERHGISVTTVDLSEFLGQAGKLSEDDAGRAGEARRDSRATRRRPACPTEKLTQMARLGVVLSRWIEANALDATAIQCWTIVQQNFGCNVCTLMSMMSERFMPSACEVDVTGVLTMYAMQLAAGSPAAIVDWNNNYGDDEDKCALFHCGNWAKSFLPDIKIATAPILGSTLGVENTYGALEGRTPAGPLTYGRVTTADADGCIRAYVGEGELTDDELNTFGTRAVAHVPQLQQLLRYICENGFEHHVVMTRSNIGRRTGRGVRQLSRLGHVSNTAAMTDHELRLKSIRYRRDLLRYHLPRRRRPHGRQPVVRRHSERAVQPRAARVARDVRRSEPRPLHPEQGAFGRGAVRRAGRPRLLSRSRARNAVPLPLAVRRPSHAQGAGHRDEHRRAGPRPVDLRRAWRWRQSWTTRRTACSRCWATANWPRAPTGKPRWPPPITSSTISRRSSTTTRCRSPAGRATCAATNRSTRSFAHLAGPCARRRPRLRATDRSAHDAADDRQTDAASSPTRSRAGA